MQEQKKKLIILGTIAMTVFHRLSVEDGVIFLGAMFLGLVTHLFNGFAELAMSIAKLPIFYKQRDLLFYPSWAYALPTWVLKIPISFLECAVWIGMTYYVIGFDPNIKWFFRHYLLLVHIWVIRSACSSDSWWLLDSKRRMKLSSLSADNIKNWSSPLMYAQNAIAVNEFLGHSWQMIVDRTQSNDTLGARGIFVDPNWYWIGVGALLGYTMLFNVLFILFLDWLGPLGHGQAVVSEEELREKQANCTGQNVELLPLGTDSNSSPSDGRGEIVRAETRKRGMVLPFTPLSITFDIVKYSVDMPQEMKDKGIIEDQLLLLKGVSGAFRPGVLTALMGVSGAGKTTLMDVLAGRKTGGYIEGDISISGYPKKQETFARIAGYCEQNDIHSPHVTIYESLLYSAWLRLPHEVDSEARKTFVEEVMELVELTPLRGALVGLPGVNGLSTEQRKRLTIAAGLMANPSIILMDEPTSGLDARAAAIVMRTVRNIVDTRRTVVCTIHQPSIDIFEAFDDRSNHKTLFLMKRGGEEIYVGPLGRNSCHLIDYFEGIQGVKKVKDGYNPATWMLEVTILAQEDILGINFAEVYRNSDLYRRNKALISELSTPPAGSMDFGTRQDLFNSLGSMYASVLFIGIQNGQTVQPIVDVEQTVFYREIAEGMYSALPYAFAQTVVYGLIVYSLIGFDWTVEKLFWYMFLMFFTFMYFTFYQMMAVAMTPNSDIAAIVSTAFYAIWNIFAGFLIPRSRIPIWWRWYSWACLVAWMLYGLVASQFGDITDVTLLDDGEIVKDFVNRYFGFHHYQLGYVATTIVGFTVLFAFVSAFSIKVFNFQRR
ncbi:LOW QUALITY PROTEIN: hypothetical protein U9M48_025263 [Paspalum notatum var. saurae]|uniref:ABC transporter domain-containing protein n=1 Tax=Paspalum notatum var. saurae TaxID=547442 RepID=A0AAQ3TP13_PASNO